jgi:two-component system response regulator FixJ
VSLLTRCEREVLYEQVAGRTTKVIARNLGVSPRTIQVFRAKIMHKLGASSLAEVISIALAADPRAGLNAAG